MALADLVVKFGADTSGLDKGFRRTRGNVESLKSGIASLVKTGLSLLGLSVGLHSLVDAYKSYAAMESNIQRTNDLFGASQKYISYFASNTAKQFGIAETAAYQYASTYGNLFKSITASNNENAKVTIAMLKGSAVVASKTGRTMDDVMERIRSGLLGNTESIEDLGINVGVASLQMTDAFKTIANGRSWDKLNYSEQQQVRTLGILEQITSKYGDTVTNNAAFSMSVLSGSFSDFGASAGLLLSAVINPIINGLIIVVRAATAATKAIGNFLGIKFNTTTSDEADSIAAANNDIATSANKATAASAKQKKALMGFQELNIADFGSSKSTAADTSGGSSASTGSSVFDSIAMPEYEAPAIDTDSAEASIAKFVGLFNFEPIKQSWQNLKTALSPIGEKVGEGLKWLWDNVLVPFSQWTISDLIPSFLDGLSAGIGVLNSVIDALTPLGQWLWDSFLQPIAQWTGGTIISILKGLADGLTAVSTWIQNNQQAVEVLAIIIGSFAAAWGILSAAVTIWNVVSAIATGITTAFGAAVAFLTSPVFLVVLAIAALIAIGVLLYKNWDTVSAWLTSVWEGIKTTAVNVWNSIKDFFVQWGPLILAILGGPIALLVYAIVKNWDAIKAKTVEIFNSVYNFLTGILTSISAWLTSAWEGIKTTAVNVWNSIKDFFVQWGPLILAILGGPIALLAYAIVKNWDAIKAKTVEIFNSVYNFLTGILTTLSAWLTSAWEGIKTTAVNVWNSIKDFFVQWGPLILAILGGPIALLVYAIVKNWDEIKSKTVEIFNSVYSFLLGIFTTIRDGVVNAWTAIRDFFVGTLNGIKNTFTSSFNAVSSFVSGIWTTISTNAKNSWNALISFFTGIKDKIQGIFSGVGSFVSNIWDGLSNGFKNSINTIISGLNVFVRGINKIKFDIPSWVPVIGGKTFSLAIPEIPKLAKGGITTGATIAQIGEAGTEAVLPLENNTGWMDTLADRLGLKLQAMFSRNTNGQQIIQIYIGNRLLREILLEEANAATLQAGKSIFQI